MNIVKKPLSRGTPRTHLRDEVSKSDEVQDALDKLGTEIDETILHDGVPNHHVTKHNLSEVNAIKTPLHLLVARRERIVGLYMMGLSAETIFKQINKDAPVSRKAWGELSSIASVHRIVSNHFSKQLPDSKVRRKHMEGLREAAFAQQELLIEKSSVFLAKKKEGTFKPFEFMASMRDLYNMRQQLIENRNWNDSRANPLVQINNASTQINVFNDNREQILNVSNPALDRLQAKLKDRFNVNDGM